MPLLANVILRTQKLESILLQPLEHVRVGRLAVLVDYSSEALQLHLAPWVLAAERGRVFRVLTGLRYHSPATVHLDLALDATVGTSTREDSRASCRATNFHPELMIGSMAACCGQRLLA